MCGVNASSSNRQLSKLVVVVGGGEFFAIVVVLAEKLRYSGRKYASEFIFGSRVVDAAFIFGIFIFGPYVRNVGSGAGREQS